MPEGLARARTLRSGVSQWEMNSFRPRRAHATRTRSGAPSSERTCSRGPGAGPSSLTSFRSTRVSSGAAYRSSSQLSPSDSPQRRDVTRPPATCQRPSQPPHPATPPPSAPPAIASGHLSMPPRSSLRRRAPSCPFVPSAPRAAHQESVRTANNHRRLPPAGERSNPWPFPRTHHQLPVPTEPPLPRRLVPRQRCTSPLPAPACTQSWPDAHCSLVGTHRRRHSRPPLAIAPP